MVCTVLTSCAHGSKKSVDTSTVTQEGLLGQKQLLWTLKDPAIVNPESAYYEPETKLIYVSNVAGGANVKDKEGWISKVDPVTGKIIEGKWVTGLNAPKGLRAHNGALWVSDIDQLVSIDIRPS